MNTFNLHTRIADTISEQGLFAPGDRVIVAVSGGADSVALLDLLATLPCYTLRLIVAHLNHSLRGDESDADEAFVRELAERYGLPCEIARCDVTQLASERGLSLEEAGREARYAFFEQLRQRYDAAAVAVAHHSDDQAETLLLRLLRGAGTAGLSGMAGRTATRVVRPLLSISRAELREHLATRGLAFREDASNADCNFLRNRVRHELLPLLESYVPGAADRLAETAGLLGRDEALLDELCSQTFTRLAQTGNDWAALPLSGITGQPEGLRTRLYRRAIAQTLGDLRRYELKHLRLIDRLCQSGQTGRTLSLPRETLAVLTTNHLLLARQACLHPQPPGTLEICAPGSYPLGNGLTLLVETRAALSPDEPHDRLQTCVDPAQAPFPWQIRPARGTDRLALHHQSGHATVKQIMIDRKLPRHLRPAIPLVLCNDTPLWLAGVQRAGLALPQAGCAPLLRLTLQGSERLPLFGCQGA